MRIGIDGRFYHESGIGRYIRNLLLELSKIDQNNEYVVFLLKKDFDNLKLPQNFHKVLADFKWYGVSEQIKFPPLLNKHKLDLMHFPHFNVPIFYTGKFVVTIHDLIHEKFEMRRASTHDPIVYKLKHLGYKKVFSHAIKKAEKIITVSNYVKDELIKNWRIDKEKIVVTHEAVEGQLIARALDCTPKKMENVLGKFTVKPPYIFYVGNAHPHKNVEGLIKAFIRVKSQESRFKDLQLVLSGQDHYFWEIVKKSQESRVKSHGDIVFTGFITDEELVALYKSAKVFVMPSFEEGFGIPILEAMACGTPVASSNIGALKEVGGDGALYFDPHNSEDMAEKITQVLNSDKLQKELMTKGKERVKQFSWEKLAEETLGVYNRLNVRKVS